MRLIIPTLLALSLPALCAAQSADIHNPAEVAVNNPPAVLPEATPSGGLPLLYDNGEFVTGIGDAPGGADSSLLQVSTLGLTTLGGTCNAGFHIADDFTIPAGEVWRVDAAEFFGYQTGSTTTSSFTFASFEIWDGRPGDVGSAVVFGDMATNRFDSTGWTNVFRYSDNNVGTTRPVMSVLAIVDSGTTPAGALPLGLELEEGDYWIRFSLGGTLGAGPFCPPLTEIGVATTGNARQFNVGTTTWVDFADGGTGDLQGVPFRLYGEASPAGVPLGPIMPIPTLSFWAMMLLGGIVVLFAVGRVASARR